MRIRVASLIIVALVAGCRGAASADAPDTSGCDNGGIYASMNSARADAGLAPYQWDDRLAAAADVRVQEMIRARWFSHRDRAGYDRYPLVLAQDGLGNYTWAGENLGIERDMSLMMPRWLNSPSHLANILDRQFDTVGISCAWTDNVDAQDIVGQPTIANGWLTVVLFIAH